MKNGNYKRSNKTNRKMAYTDSVLKAAADRLLNDIDQTLVKYADELFYENTEVASWLSDLYLQLYVAYTDLIARMSYKTFREYSEKVEYYEKIYRVLYRE